jgi:fumarate reductase subunit D
VLVVLLAAHLAGGLRVMALEFLGWRARQKDMVAVSAGLALLVGLVFLLNVV